MNRGDLILYRSSGRWYERLITLATKGPYVHVAIVLDATFVIAADTQGIRCDVAPALDNLHTTIPLAAHTTSAGIDRGLAWAQAQIGRRYGWLDIVYQAMKFLWPGNPLRFTIAGHMDCSDFATRYMLQADVALPPAFDDPYTISPNDIARVFDVIPEKKVVNT